MSDNSLGVLVALGVEAFVSIHMSLFVLMPLSKILSKDNSKKMFWKLFGIRAGILLFFDFFITTNIAMVDFIAVFIGGFLIVPLSGWLSNRGTLSTAKQPVFTEKQPMPAEGKLVRPQNFDPMFSLSEEDCLESFLEREMNRIGLTDSKHLIPEEVLRRKNILNILFAVLLFLFVSMIFFHFPIAAYALGLVILVVYGILTSRYKLMNYLKKEVKSRPQEKISNIVMQVQTSLVPDYSGKLKIMLSAVAVAAALFVFAQPHILYEEAEDGCFVRFYTFGVTNMTTASIPDTYNGEPVTGLRGNTFSNMPLLKEVDLPNTITEIRGQAFKNCRSLQRVTLPNRLTYLGGGAFYNCKSLEAIALPDTVTELGGEAFYGCSALSAVKLSAGLTEIRGNTFENCSSLQRVEIPDPVVRIGGHAFYGNSSLSEVSISPTSRLQEIGSSAFRCCNRLEAITLPTGVFINDRAFKESPTKINYYEH
ncbi:MAG: leucine-rich repeat domain-containing protein [Acetatifactor sp.]